MSTPANSTAPLATTIAPTTPPASNVIDFFTAPVTTADEHDVKLALAGGATREELGLEPNPAKDNATPAPLRAEAGADDASGAGLATEGTAGTGSGDGEGTPVQRLVKTQIAKLEGELAALAPQAGDDIPGSPVKQLVQKEIARLQKEVEALKGGTASTGEEGTGEETTGTAAVEVPPVTGPIAGRPLALVRDERGLNFLQQTAKQVKGWARQNAEGGEMPAELRGSMEKANQLITGNKDSKLTLAEDFLDTKAVGHFLGLAEDMLDERIPQQRDFLAAENAAHTAVVKESPAYFDPKKPEGQLVNRILTVYPWMRQVPEWPGLVRDLATGFLQNRSDAGRANKQGAKETNGGKKETPSIDTPPVTTTDGKIVPLAPAAPIGGSSAAPAAPTQRAITEAMQRAEEGKATDADWRLLTEYAA